MRSRSAQVDRIDALLAARIPCYRDPWSSGRRRAGPDGKVYPVGERWEWRRIALRREAVGAILELDADASVRVVRDVLARYGHRVSHEQVRLDIALVRGRPPGLVESGRWLSVEAWRDETARRRAMRPRAGRLPQRRTPARPVHVREPLLVREPTPASARVQKPPPAGPPCRRRDDWAVWDDGPRRR